MRILESPIFVADTETTGLEYSQGDRIVEFAAKRFPGGDEYSSLVNPGRDIPIVASAVHGLIAEDLVDAPTLEEAYASICRFIPRDSVVVFHNAAFDTTMLPCLSGRRFLCTKRLAQHLIKDAPAFSNQVLRYHLGGAKIDLRGIPPHRAIADVIVTSFVLGKLLDTYFAAGHPDDVDALLELAASPVHYSHFPMGKHRNQPISGIDEGYLRWAIGPRGMVDMDPDLRASLEFELRQRRGMLAI